MATPRRHWHQFSLRTAFVGLTVFAVWLGIVVNRAREQREAIKAVRELRGDISYDDFCYTPSEERIAWLRRRLAGIIGKDYVYNVQEVRLLRCHSCDREILELFPHLQGLWRLRTLKISIFVAKDTEQQLAAALPDCKVIRTANRWH